MRKPAELLALFSLFSEHGLFRSLATASASPSPQAIVIIQPTAANASTISSQAAAVTQSTPVASVSPSPRAAVVIQPTTVASSSLSSQAAVVLQPTTTLAQSVATVTVITDDASDDEESDEEAVTVTVLAAPGFTTPISQGTLNTPPSKIATPLRVSAIPLPVIGPDGTATGSVILAAPADALASQPVVSSANVVPSVAPSQAPVSELTARELCTSGPFQLTRKNWNEAGTVEWIQEFTKEWRDQAIYEHYGLLGTIAYTHLGRSDYKCGMGTLSACSVTCQEVVSSVADKWEARNVYFALVAGKHYLQHMEAVDKALQNAAFTISQWIPQMSFSFFWWRHNDYENLLNAVRQFARSAFMIAVHGAHNQLVPLFDITTAIEATYGQGMRIKQAHDRAAEAFQHWDWFSTAVSQFEDQHRSSQFAEGQQALERAFTTPNYIVSRPRKFTDWEGNHHMAQEANIAQMSLYISEIVGKVRQDHYNAVNAVLQSDAIEANGDSLFTMILKAGDFVSPFNDSAKKRTQFLETKMTNALKYQVFNLGIRSQTTWIQCTKAFADINGTPVSSCEEDTSGPPNLKACVDDRVCYLYKWDNKNGVTNDHLVEIMGAENFHKPPFNLHISDIITSSVLTHIAHMDHAQLSRLWMGKDLEHIFEASAPGSFNIPVCVRDGENWNTPLKPYRYFRDDLNPWSLKKTLPCYCGNEWGGSTAHVWDESGLAHTPKFADYRLQYCPALIEKKVQTPLEKFIAYCQLDIVKRSWLQGYKIGKHTFCEYAIDIVTREAHGGPQNMDPKLKTALQCKLGLYDKTVDKKTCKMFYSGNENDLDEKLRSGLGTTVEDVARKAQLEKERLAELENYNGQTERSEPRVSDWSFVDGEEVQESN